MEKRKNGWTLLSGHWARCLFAACWLLIGLLPACAPQNAAPSVQPWGLADVHWLQTQGEDPSHSLIALYSRTTPEYLEIRFDFLDLAAPRDFDLYLALDSRPGGSRSLPIAARCDLNLDVVIKLPASGLSSALDADLEVLPGLIPIVSEDADMDMLTILLRRSQLPGNAAQVGLQAFLTAAGSPTPLSLTAAVYPGQHSFTAAPLLFVFWNTLPSNTPALTLRRWDGAHTGPYGGRHGLNVLLQASAQWRMPLILADLTQPASLYGLNAVHGTAAVQRAVWRGDVTLADSACGDPLLAPQSLAASRQAAQASGFPPSQIAFGAFSTPLPPQYIFYFADLPKKDHLVRWNGVNLIPLPQPVFPDDAQEDDDQVSLGGVSIALRSKLLATALSADISDWVVLGGSLPESPWGESSLAAPAFHYITAHPWMKVLTWQDLLRFPSRPAVADALRDGCADLLCTPPALTFPHLDVNGAPSASAFDSAAMRAAFRPQLSALNPDGFSAAAVQTYLSLTQPTLQAQLAGLQANALGQVGWLIAAARWQEHPTQRADCETDLDLDGLPECILASPQWLLILSTQGGRLVYAAHRSHSGAQQWIGFASQSGVGLGDPSQWQPQRGLAGNPAEIAGAFAAAQSISEPYTAAAQPGRIILRRADGRVEKSFLLSGADLRVEVSFPGDESILIPIMLSPLVWTVGQAGRLINPPVITDQTWAYQAANGAGLSIRFEGDVSLSSASSLDSASALLNPENPNLAYPPGHYLPFPLAVITARGQAFSAVFHAP